MGRHLPGHAALPLETWPIGDQNAYQAACIKGDPFQAGGLAANWRPATHASRIGAYGRFLGYAIRMANAGELLQGPTVISPGQIGTYLRFLRERGSASRTIASTVQQLHAAATALWPGTDWRWLAGIRNREERLAEPLRHKEARIVPQGELVRLGWDMMRKAEEVDLYGNRCLGPLRAAVGFRDGLMIALLALRPLRRTNFLALSLGGTLQLTPEGWDIVLPGSMTKNHTPLRQPLPAVLLPALTVYIDTHRAVLAACHGVGGPRSILSRPPRSALWLSKWGCPLTNGGLQVAVENATRRHFGQHVNVHLFRDCAATSLADEHPEHVKVAADLLGHRSFATTQKYYIASGQRRALREVQRTILDYRTGKRRRNAPCPSDNGGGMVSPTSWNRS